MQMAVVKAGMPRKDFISSFEKSQTDLTWIEKHIRAKRKHSSTLSKLKNDILRAQRKLISIENKTVQCEEIAFSFDLDDFSQKRILEGLDKIDITLEYTDQIDSFCKSRKKWMPKLA